MRRSILPLLLLVVPMAAARSQGDGSHPLSFHLALRHPDAGPTMPGIRVDLQREWGRVSENFTSRWEARVRGALDATSRADRNPEDSFVEGAWGHQWAPGARAATVLDTLSSAGTDYGFLGVYGDARYEANQPFTERLASLQLRVLYTHNHHTGAWLLVPQAQAAFGATRSLGSDTRDRLGLEATTNARLDAELLWLVDFSAFATGAASHVSMRAEWRAFRATGTDAALAALGFARGNYGALEGAVAVRRWSVPSLFARWTRGRLPTQPADVVAWQVGVRR
jgi:hypothetical protein